MNYQQSLDAGNFGFHLVAQEIPGYQAEEFMGAVEKVLQAFSDVYNQQRTQNVDWSVAYTKHLEFLTFPDARPRRVNVKLDATATKHGVTFSIVATPQTPPSGTDNPVG